MPKFVRANSIEEVFWPYVNPMMDDRGCWEWSGKIGKNGYAFCHDPGSQARTGKPKSVYGHRVSYWIHNGPIPAGMDLDHLCRNRACVNPTHLEAVTHRTNVLRGTGASARNAKKTHCDKCGEPLTTYPNGKRRCRSCVLAYKRATNPKYWQIYRERHCPKK